ncbi:hypothetical protein N7537_011783 [Penicillium hordei]|uniref:Uncharacterized protein n=1 Tax=Penicillium hordei TaxID=40994 RepID=A0AAD6DN05_9EURO|nr:uncharacterized protein N7537_011783 [Penicillium hordei]KAJ5589105.1 hypothetical protein N7537_011783 [Penicillium hordei]
MSRQGRTNRNRDKAFYNLSNNFEKHVLHMSPEFKPVPSGASSGHSDEGTSTQSLARRSTFRSPYSGTRDTETPSGK